MDKDHKLRRRKKVYIAFAISILVVLIIVVLALTVFNAKYAITRVNAAYLKDLSPGINEPKMGIDLNVTIVLDVSVRNSNPASFKYNIGSACLYYRGFLVGEAEIPEGEISANETKDIDVILTILADRLISNSGVYSDIVAGRLLFQTTTRIAGKVTILSFIRHRLVTYSFCDLTIDIRSRTLVSNVCRYRNEL